MLVSYRQDAEAQNAKLQDQLDSLGKTLTELVLDDSPESSQGADDALDREAAISQLREERATANASKALLHVLVEKSEKETESQHPSVHQTNSWGPNNSGNQVATNFGGIHWTAGSR